MSRVARQRPGERNADSYRNTGWYTITNGIEAAVEVAWRVVGHE